MVNSVSMSAVAASPVDTDPGLGYSLSRSTDAEQEDDFLALLTRIFSLFVDVPAAETEQRIQYSLELILKFFGADRCVFFRVREKDKVVDVVQIAEHNIAVPLPESMDAGALFPWMFQQVVEQHQTLRVSALEDLPAAAETDKASLLALQISSFLLIPIQVYEGIGYVISISSSVESLLSPSRQVARLKLLGEIFSSALRKKKLKEMQSESARFDQLIADISARFSTAWSDQLDHQINLALHEVMAFAGSDQAGFLTVDLKRNQLLLTHLVHIDGIQPAGMAIDYAATHPWLYQKLAQSGEPFAFSHRDALPSEAAVDRQSLEQAGIVSGFNIPFKVDGVLRYIFAMTSNREPRVWPEDFFDRLSVLGGVFVSALSRKAMFDALRRAENFSAATLNSVQKYVCVVDSTGRIVLLSEGWKTLYPTSAAATALNLFDFELRLDGQDPADAIKLSTGARAVLNGELMEYVSEFPCSLFDDHG